MTGNFIRANKILQIKNLVNQSYDPVILGIKYNYLLGSIPVVDYKIDF